MFARRFCRLVSVSTAIMGSARTAHGTVSGVGSACANCVRVKTMLGPVVVYVLGVPSKFEDAIPLGAHNIKRRQNFEGLRSLEETGDE